MFTSFPGQRIRVIGVHRIVRLSSFVYIYYFVIVRGNEVSETFTFVLQNRIIVCTMFVFVPTAQ